MRVSMIREGWRVGLLSICSRESLFLEQKYSACSCTMEYNFAWKYPITGLDCSPFVVMKASLHKENGGPYLSAVRYDCA